MQDRNDTIDIFFALCIYIEGKRKTNLSINHRRAWCILLSAWHVEIRKTHLRNEILKSILSGCMMTCPAPVTSISYWWWNCVFVAFGPHKRMGHILTSKDSIFDFLKWQIFQRELIIKRSDCLVWLFGSYEKHLNRRHCLNWFLSVSFVILHFFTLFVLLLKSRDQFDMITGLDYGLCKLEKMPNLRFAQIPSFLFTENVIKIEHQLALSEIASGINRLQNQLQKK